MNKFTFLLFLVIIYTYYKGGLYFEKKKKILFSLILILLLLPFVKTSKVSAVTPELPALETYENSPAYIPDTTLKAAILDNLGKDSDYEITNNDMKSIRVLDLSNKKIKDISGLEYCTNLIEVNLSNNSISNIKPLTKLNSLKEVNLKNNRITDISCLYNTRNKDVFYDINDQYIVLPYDSSIGDFTLNNIIKDKNHDFYIQPSNNGHYDKNSNSITWTNLAKNTTLSYLYASTLWNQDTTTMNAPSFEYTCKVNKYIVLNKKCDLN